MIARSLEQLLFEYFPNWLAFAVIGVVGGAFAYVVANRYFIQQLRKGHRLQLRIKDEQLAIKDEVIKALRNEKPTEIIATLQRIEDKIDKLATK